jgi:hypothetical protein
MDGQWLSEAMSHRPETPVGRSGKVRVQAAVQPAGKVLPVVSARNAIFMGQRVASVRFSHDVTYRELVHDDRGTWMTDSAQEIYQCREPVNAVAGMGRCRLLIGGLGLGCYSAIALAMTNAKVTTVEMSRDVLRLVEGAVHGKRHRVVHGDVYRYAMAMRTGQFDAAILDTWQPTGEMCWVEEVIPLRRLVRPKVDVVYCWNEQEMIGQFKMGAGRKILLDADELPACDSHYRTLSMAARDEGLLGPGWKLGDMRAQGLAGVLQAEAELPRDVHSLIDAFCDDIGSRAWEDRFGALWDRAAAAGLKKAKSKPNKRALVRDNTP